MPVIFTEALPAPADLVAQVTEYLRATRAFSILATHRRDWTVFKSRCSAAGLPFVPATPDMVVLYLTAPAAKLVVVTLGRWLTAIATAHR